MKITHVDSNTLQISYKEPHIPFIGLYITTLLSKTGESYIETKRSFSNKRERVSIDAKRIDNVSIYSYFAIEKDGGKTKTSGLALNYADKTSYPIASGHLQPEGSFYTILRIKRPQPLLSEVHQIASFLGVPVVNIDDTLKTK